jgi:hypothetical protein
MDAEAPEAHRALDVFSDTALSPRPDGTSVRIEWRNPAAERVGRAVLRETGLLERSWGHMRGYKKLGDHFVELVFDRNGILREVRDLPAREMRRAFGDAARGLPRAEYPWAQVSLTTGAERARFREWQVAHLADVPPGEVYGFRGAQLSGARRPWRAVELCQNAVLAERVLHTGTRLAFSVDVTGLSTDEAIEYIREVRSEYQRTRTASGDARGSTFTPISPMDDMWVPWTAGGPQKPVEVLRFGAEIGDVADVRMVHGRYLSALDVPRYMLGIDEDLRSRSATGYIDAAFIRSVTRSQGTYLRWLLTILDRALFAAGFVVALEGDRRSIYRATLPDLQLVDEKVRWEIAKIRAEVASVYGADLGVVGRDFVLTHFLGLTDAEAAAAGAGSPGPSGAAKAPGRASSAKEQAVLETFRGTDPLSRLAGVVGWEEARRMTEEVLLAVRARLDAPDSDRLPPGGGA